MPRGHIDNEGYYKVLEVSKTADTATITKAYRRLARKKHPDKGGDPEEFKALAEAYEVLSDPERRRVYDQLGKEGLEGAGGSGGMDQSRQQADLFRSFFGRFSQPQTPRMRDVVYEMEVTLEELCRGGTKKVRIWGERPAGEAGRSSDKDGERFARDIEIALQNTMHTGTRIVVEGGVEPIHDGVEPGDLVFVIRESRHRTFRRLGDGSPHLAADITVTLAEALLGFVRPVSLVDGRTVYYQPGDGEVISPGAVRKLKGCGMPVGEGVHGDLYLRFSVEFPTSKAASAWGKEGRKSLETLLPAKPKFARDRKSRVEALQDAEPHIQSRFKAGLYDRSPRGASGRTGLGDAWGAAGGGRESDNPFGFFGL